MKKSLITILNICAAIVWLHLFVSCNKQEETLPIYDYTCIIINQGNYSEQNGSLSLLKKDGSIEQEVYTKANAHWKPASIIESAVLYQDLLILMCSNEDKVEIIDNKTFKIRCEPVREIGIPRYCAVYNNIAYVTCTNNWNPDENGHVCLIDLASKNVVKKITVNGIPEGIKEVAGRLYVATGNGMAIINAATGEVARYVELSGQNGEFPGQELEAKHIVSDYKEKLWVSFTSSAQTGIASFDVHTNRFSSFIPLKNMPYTGNIDMAPDGKTLFYLTASGIVGGQNMEAETAIYPFDIENEKAAETPLITGTGFYGFNVNPSNGDIYTANVNGFVANSVMYIYNASGKKITDGMITGVGTCRFVFR